MQKYQSARILSRVNIVDIIKTYLPLEKRGENYRAKCPFHTDNDPSFSVRNGKCFHSAPNESWDAIARTYSYSIEWTYERDV